MATTGPIPVDEEIFLFGVCHERCLDLASFLLRSGYSAFEHPLTQLLCDNVDNDVGHLRLPADELTCLFCNGTEEPTDEHIWPRWLSRELRSMGRTLAPLPNTRRRPTRTIDFTVPVCRPCNNEWLSTLENDVSTILRPMLWGEFVVLTPDQQALVATWATKTAFLIDRINNPIVPRFYPMELATSRRPSPNAIVVIGAYNGGRWAVDSSSERLPIGNPGSPPPTDPTMLVVTFTAYKIALQVTMPIVPVVEGSVSIETSSPDPDPCLAQIWPLTGENLSWPPSVLLGDAGLESLVKRLTPPHLAEADG